MSQHKARLIHTYVAQQKARLFHTFVAQQKARLFQSHVLTSTIEIIKMYHRGLNQPSKKAQSDHTGFQPTKIAQSGHTGFQTSVLQKKPKWTTNLVSFLWDH